MEEDRKVGEDRKLEDQRSEDHPDVKALFSIRDTLYQGNPLRWLDEGRPSSSSEMNTWYTSSVRDQTSFLVLVAQELLRKHMIGVYDIVMQTIHDLNSIKDGDRYPKLKRLTQGLFSTLKTVDMHKQSPSLVLTQVFGSIDTGIIPVTTRVNAPVFSGERRQNHGARRARDWQHRPNSEYRRSGRPSSRDRASRSRSKEDKRGHRRG